MRISRFLKTGLTVLVVGFCCASISFAGDKVQKKDQIQKKDSSCQSIIQQQDSRIELAKDQIRKRNRKKDGSCQTYILEKASSVKLAADQIRKKDRKKDGSCQS